MKVTCIVLVVLLVGCASTPEDKARWRAVSDVFGAYASANGVQQPAPVVTPPYDYAYAWDLVHLQYNPSVWQCRGIQTGQYAHESKCAYRAKVDYWPNN